MLRFNYFFYNLSAYLLIFLLSGCGITLAGTGQVPDLINANQSGTSTLNRFQVKKLQIESDFDGLPNKFLVFKSDLSKYDFYYFSSPTQNTGGYQFELTRMGDSYKVCLKKPSPMASVLMGLTNPTSLLVMSKGGSVDLNVNYCK